MTSKSKPSEVRPRSAAEVYSTHFRGQYCAGGLWEAAPVLCQYFTPQWAAELIVERYFPELSPGDLVIEPSCGEGAFLAAIPRTVPAIGVEIDPEMAAEARALTGRHVITGDFTSVELPDGVTALVGTPPSSCV